MSKDWNEYRLYRILEIEYYIDEYIVNSRRGSQCLEGFDLLSCLKHALNVVNFEPVVSCCPLLAQLTVRFNTF